MSRRAFNRYMVQVGMGSHPKFGRLTDSEFRAHIVGVLSVAAIAPIRGCLLVGELEAEPADIARAAGVTVRVARSAMDKLQALGVLYRDAELSCLRVHDWDDINPEPRADATNADRQRRLRERRRNDGSNASNDAHNADVTPPTAQARGSTSTSSSSSPSSTTSQGGDRKQASRRANQDELPASLPDHLRTAAHTALSVLSAVQAERGGDDPTLRGVGLALARFPNRDHTRIVRELEHWALAGTGQGRPVKDWARTFATFLERSPAGAPPKVGNGSVTSPSGRDERRARRAAAMDSLLKNEGDAA